MWNDSHILSCSDMKRNGPHKYPSIQYDGIYETPHKIDEGHATSDEGSTNTFVPGN